jgi:hypothetical protein
MSHESKTLCTRCRQQDDELIQDLELIRGLIAASSFGALPEGVEDVEPPDHTSAAPLDLPAILDEFVNQCGSCDAGMAVACICSKRDFRPVMLSLVHEIDRYRDAITDLAGDCEAFPEDHAWATALASTAARLRLILAGERP